MLLLLAPLLFTPASHAAAFHVVGDLVQESSLSAGQSADGEIVLKNEGTTPQELVVYPREAGPGASGPAVAGSNQSWLRLTPQHITVAPQGTARLPYRVEVPEDAVVAGAYGAEVVIEEAPPAPVWPPPADEAAAPASAPAQYAVAIVTHLGP